MRECPYNAIRPLPVGGFSVTVRFRTLIVGLLSFALLAPLVGGVAPSEARATLPHATTVALATPPVRVQVKEPQRVQPPKSPGARRPTVVEAVRPRNGVRVPGPPMLRPSEIDVVIKSTSS
ncbi:MAG: hypothetical protein JWM85_3628, partial [Acidimicrobiaceae bacterium]|nr:hypothetical protein [Acidimicrobiaceae bacterium]